MLAMLNKRGNLLAYSVEVPTLICKHKHRLLEKDEHRFGSVSDFSTKLSISELNLDVEVQLTFYKRPAMNNEQPRDKTINSSQKLSTARDRVAEIRKLSKSFDGWEYIYVRLGTTRSVHTGSNSESSEDGRSSDIASATDDDVDMPKAAMKVIARETLLVGYYFRGHQEQASDLELMKVQSWDFGDYWIGDCVDRWHEHKFSTHDDYLQAFQDVASPGDLHERVMTYLSTKANDPAPELPIMPTYTLKTFDPAEDSVFQESADILVRYVSHVVMGSDEEDETSDADVTTDVEFEMWDTQFKIGSDWDADEIEEVILKGLKEAAEDEANIHTATLFNELTDKWELQMWVLPQESDVKTLYRFPDMPNQGKNGLGEYMSKQKVAKNDKRVYMEAHIVPKG